MSFCDPAKHYFYCLAIIDKIPRLKVKWSVSKKMGLERKQIYF